MKTKSHKLYKQSDMLRIMELASAEYHKQISDNIKRGIAQAKLRKLAEQKEPSHE